MLNYDVIVIGGGPAGMAAAISAYDNGIKSVAIIDREDMLGGILNQCIHLGFGLHKLKRELTGPEYAYEYIEMIKKRNITVYYKTTVTSLTKNKEITAFNADGILQLKAKAVVLAMGCRERSRGAINICGSRPSGVFTAGTAQKLMNIQGFKVGNSAVILGSGDIGLIMARRMSLCGIKVEAVCEILPYSNGLARNIEQCLNDFSIPLYLSTTVIEICGTQRLEGVVIAQVDDKRNVLEETKRFIPCDTLLLSCGLIPENELTRQAGIMLDAKTSGAVVDDSRQTSIDGFFACGNVLHVHDLVDFVSDEGELAGLSAASYVLNNCKKQKSINVQAKNGIKYALPQKIQNNCQTELFFRVVKPFSRSKIIVKADGIEITSKSVQKLVPSQMEKIKIDKIVGDVREISIEIEEML